MDALSLTSKLSPYMYLSKVMSFQQCPKKYYWQHHLHLQPRDRPSYFAFGSAFHKAVIECGLASGMWPAAEAYLSLDFNLLKTLGIKLKQKDYDLISGVNSSDRELMQAMLETFAAKWQALNSPKTLSLEQSVTYELLNPYFKYWVAKADFIFEDHEGTWVGDLKTTSSYGSSVARYYHSSPQTKTYFYILQKLIPNLKGTKIFVCTKQKVRTEVETILLTEADKYEAELFINEALSGITKAEINCSYPRNMTNCVNSYGQECPYKPICTTPIKSEEYLNDVIANWFILESPDEHLELETEAKA